jgi:hypothetical protein
MTDPSRQLLRHAVAALAYRAARVCENAPPGFEAVRAGDSTRSAGELLAHMGDLFDWAAKLAGGVREWNPVAPQTWAKDVDRFFAALAKFDAALASDAPLGYSAGQLLQGPVADALTHVGQLAMLRRLAGVPQIGESYFGADIAVGRITKTLPPPAAPFK